ncbi:hypothetical protein A4H97_29970 [Niastella yeongjuensis]|uniref:Uncharacterized protein n=1 Tax=Niastella yeongjuensis TaxID=354355 RepID=A0A1V9EPV5_9BACT|nr:FecR family protein [Niastella yeongjuensis]OQP48062.1 hypothetical protein A4H97_29970 [Niastella yeongjuensis]
MLHNKQIPALILKFLRAELTPAEEIQFNEWINADPRNAALVKNFEDDSWVYQEMRKYGQGPSAAAEKNLRAKLNQAKGGPVPPIEKKITHPFFRYMMAAAAIAVIVVGTIYIGKYGTAKKSDTPTVTRVDSTNDPMPGKDTAVLTLADGTKYTLNDTADGTIAKQGNVEFSKKGGVIYCKAEPGSVAPKNIGYNTLATPKGGNYQLVLPDGSRVWLNAETQIQFPTVDTGNKRMVTLVGEAYFEVAKNKAKPFIVKANGGDITVLGTHFNVIAYPNESFSKATLIEGSIGIASGGEVKLITPSQSGLYTMGSKPTVFNEDNVDRIIAWTNHQFSWNGDSLTTALREIERWYTVKVEYKGETPTTILENLNQPKKKSLKDLLNDLTIYDSSVSYKLEGRTIFVSTQKRP